MSTVRVSNVSMVTSILKAMKGRQLAGVETRSWLRQNVLDRIKTEFM